MRIAIDAQTSLQSDCNITAALNLHESVRSLEFEKSILTQICPGFFDLERIDYMLSLLNVNTVRFNIYKSLNSLKRALINGDADVSSYPDYVRQVINFSHSENLSFIAPFTQDSVCLFQPANAMLNQSVTIDDKFWIAPFGLIYWMIFLCLIGLVQGLLANRHRYKCKVFYNDCIVISSIVLAAFATFIYACMSINNRSIYRQITRKLCVDRPHMFCKAFLFQNVLLKIFGCFIQN